MMTQSRISNLAKPILAFLFILTLYSILFRKSDDGADKILEPHGYAVDNEEDPLFLKQQFMQHGLSNNNNNKKAGGKDANTNKLQPDKAIVIDKTFLDQMDKKTHKCPDYVVYSQKRHPPFSIGRFKYPYMRPAPKCRTFVSTAVESVIEDLKSKIEDPDLARLLENCLPNTLDTTILWHQPKIKTARQDALSPQSFIVTGDIHAEWLRDAARQLSVYQPMVRFDPKLKELILGAINTQAYYIINSPYCNAFHPPPGSGVKRGDTAFDQVHPKPDWKQVFECKYELDSLASFLTLTNEYYENSKGDTSFINSSWLKAFEKVLIILHRESVPSFDQETGQMLPFYYSFQRNTNIGSETLPLGGVGNPVNYGTGLIRSAFRPSDDATILQFFIPANIHMLTELKRARNTYLTNENIARDTMLVETTDTFINALSTGIEKYGIVNHPIYGKVYAYEVDGYGSATFMDDANIPSLLSIPDLGYTKIDDEIYQNTRKMILSKQGNPYYLKGHFFEGIGGPHIGIRNAWPMSLLMRIRTTDDDDEIISSLEMIMRTTANLGLMHESVNVNSRQGRDYTRSWFAWCNSEFGKTILHLAKNKPHLIFKKEWQNVPYDIESVLSQFI
ncbi:hypothetical protein V4U94_005835 [Candida albicans]|nr:hypothetical protein MEY_05137 [Candida albicans 19F]KHC30276.1 hypothetical protein MGO_05142 [Candida albicans P76055]KHC62629.1 hypothetical protein MGI_05148 [Candida albicans P75016]